jgi:hypothetical protein
MVPNSLKYWQSPLKAPYMFSISHNNNVKTRCEGKSISKYGEFFWYENVGGVGALNFTLHLVNQLMNLFLVYEPCVTSMVNPNVNLGFQILTLGI